MSDKPMAEFVHGAFAGCRGCPATLVAVEESGLTASTPGSGFPHVVAYLSSLIGLSGNGD
jgi:hypothetical protein